MTLGNKIKILRNERNLTQKDLAKASGLAEITVRKYEADEFKPKIEQLVKLAKALDVPVDELNERNFWIGADNKLAVKIPFDFLNYDLQKYQDDLNQRKKRIAEIITEDGFQSDFLVEIFEKLVSMNAQGQTKAIEHIRDIADFPKYQRTSDTVDEN